MTITLESDLVTSIQIISYHAKKIDELESIAGIRAYSDLVLQEIMNTVIQFILGNAPSTASENILKYAIKYLCKIELNNTMHNKHQLPDWENVDTFNKEFLIEMLTGITEGEDPSSHLFIFNNTTEM